MKWSELSPRERDALVAEKVFGHKVVKTVWGKQKQYSCLSIGEPNWWDDHGASELANPVPAYSTQIAAAWEVVEEMQRQNFVFEFKTFEAMGGGGSANFRPIIPSAEDLWRGHPVFISKPEAPEAICLAALRACGVDV